MSKVSAKCQRLLYSRPGKFKSAAQIPEGMHQLRLHEETQMMMPKCKLGWTRNVTASRDGIPAEASVKSLTLCIRTWTWKVIRETLCPEETKQKHESSGSSSSLESSSSMKVVPLLETLKRAKVLRAIVLSKGKIV